MTSRRVLKAASAIREVVSMAILTDMNDPRVRDVTVLGVTVSPDMREAKVHVTIMGDDTKQRLSLKGLQSAAGYLQSKIAKRIDTRYTPKLEFVLDLGVKKSIEMAQILHRVLPAEENAADDDQPDGDAHAPSAQGAPGPADDTGPADDDTQPAAGNETEPSTADPPVRGGDG